MFTIATRLGISPVHGIGVFAAQPVPTGSLIWVFTPAVDLRLTADDLAALPPVLAGPVRRYCYLEEDGTYVLCGDNARFMNHSFDPNCDDRPDDHTVARRHIALGEELTCDYRVFDVESRRAGLVEWSSDASGDPDASGRGLLTRPGR